MRCLFCCSAALLPKTGDAHPAALFLHGSGGNREDLLLPAVELARRGAVTMTISQPNNAQTFRPLVVNARRALDLLAARRDVDAHRLGLVGFSLGSQTAAILAGDEDRRVPRAQLQALIRAAPGHPRVRSYDTKHGMNRRTLDDQVQWQAAELGVG